MSNFKNLIAVLQSANPKKNVTEAKVRKAIEDGQIKKPSHPFLWAKEEVEAAAKALGLAVPSEAEIEASFPGSMSLKAYRKPYVPTCGETPDSQILDLGAVR